MTPASPARDTAEQARTLLAASLGHELDALDDDDLAISERMPSPEGAWSVQDWASYLGMRVLVPGTLRRWIGTRGQPGAWIYSAAGEALIGLGRLLAWISPRWRKGGRPAPSVRPGPDGMRIVLNGLPIPGNAGTTYGNVIHLWPDPSHTDQMRALLDHEYVHVLQVRRDGALFLARYLWASYRARRRGAHHYWGNPYEVQAYAVERHLMANPWLPDVWDLPHHPPRGSNR